MRFGKNDTAALEAAAARSEAAASRVEGAVARFEQLLRQSDASKFATMNADAIAHAEAMRVGASSLSQLIHGFEVAHKGIEVRIQRVLRESTADLLRIATSRNEEIARLQIEAERWRSLAVANFEAAMEELPPNVQLSARRKPRKHRSAKK